MGELKNTDKKALAQRERVERLPMRLLFISMKIQLKQCKINLQEYCRYHCR